MDYNVIFEYFRPRGEGEGEVEIYINSRNSDLEKCIIFRKRNVMLLRK